MKIKTEKQCKACNKSFKLFKSTDKYCSFTCMNKDRKATDKTKEPTRIKASSIKRKAEELLYRKERKIFLSKPENLICPVMLELENKKVPAIEIHHKAGRVGKLLNYSPMWLAVSREGHMWIHDNPEQAYNYEFLIPSSTVSFK